MDRPEAKKGFGYIGRRAVFVVVLVIVILWFWKPLSAPEYVKPRWQMYPRIWVNGPENVRSLKNSFTILSNNILSERYVRPGTYLYASQGDLDKSVRHSRLMTEVQTLKPDIVHMQEAEQPYFSNHLEPDMLQLGYKGLVSVDQGRSTGQATFWRMKKFTLLESNVHLFHEMAAPYVEKSNFLKDDEKKELKNWLVHPYRMISIHLRDQISGAKLLAGNLHLVWDGLRSPSLQTMQSALAFQALSDLSKKTGTQTIVITGDFNTPPTYPAYDFIQRGKLDPSIRDRIVKMTDKSYRDFYVIKLADLIPDAFHHPLSMSSAYYKAQGQEPEITNADTIEIVNGKDTVTPMCLDYIWYSNNSLALGRVLQLPDKPAILKHTGLPSPLFPSDHLPLMAKFYFK